MTRIALVTTATTDTVDATAALHETAVRRWPVADLHVLTSSRLGDLPAGWTLVPASEVDDTPFATEGILDETDQVALALPRLLQRLTESYDVCVFVDPGHLLTSPADRLVEHALDHGTVLVVPAQVTPMHTLTPDIGSIEPDPPAGAASVIAVTGRSGAFLGDWARTVSECVLDVDQRSISWAVDRFLRHAVGRTDIMIEGEVTLLHWSHYAAVEAGRADGPGAAIIECQSLIASTRAEARSDDPEVAWSLLVHRVHDSRPIQPFLDIIEGCRSFFDRDALETPFHLLCAEVRRAADPFGRRWKDDDALVEWLFESNPVGCTRLAHLVAVDDRARFQNFPEVRFDPGRMREWFREEGRDELGFDAFDPRFPPRHPEETAEEDEGFSLMNAIRWRLTSIRLIIPGHLRRSSDRALRRYLGPAGVERRSITPPRHIPSERTTPMWGSSPRGLNLLGPFRSESGLGQAARASLHALRLLDRPFSHVDLTEKYPSRNAVEVGLEWDTHGQLGDVNLIHTNADEMLTMAGGAYKHRFGGRFNAAMWFWESAELPMRARPALHLVDELWVASSYQRDVFGQYGMVPVHVIGLAADLPEQRDVDRSRYGWRDDELVFLFVYDALSSYGRKNPRKAMDAFIAAFGPRFDGVRFVLKVSNLNKFPQSQKEILGLVDEYPAITVIDDYLSREDVLDLMAAADVSVSLHAAEGLGLTLLESMAMGTPVICTGYSGNMDFTTDTNSWLVGYDMMRTDERTGPYPEGSIWASPRVDDAADVMRHIGTHREEIAVKAAVAREDALHAASLERYAARLDAQLRRVL
jgi:glycosyltransferase involved in cell wall biosynthesis